MMEPTGKPAGFFVYNSLKTCTMQIFRETPSDLITELKEGEVFVFGSNLAGKHGRGAAKTALKWGAVYGKGSGLHGKTYGIPTKDRKLRVLPINHIALHVNRFTKFAKEHSNLTFLVTEIGCGLAGYNPTDIAPLFEEAAKLSNVRLPRRFWNVLISKPINPNDPEVQRLLKLTKEQQEKTKALQKIDPNTGKLTITI